MKDNSVLEKIMKFNEDRDWGIYHTPANLSKSIVIEAAELLEHFQWDDAFDIQEVKEELADIFMYAIMLAEKLDLDIEEIILEKLNKNEKKYQIKDAKGNSKKYTEF